MNSEGLTSLLITLLIISVSIFVLLLIIFVVLTIRKRMKDKQIPISELEVNGTVDSNKSNNIVQTKSYTTQNIKSFLDFDEIKDNMIVQDKGKRLVMVIQCQGINYDLMSSMEKVAVEKGFVQFLNSLTRPIQLYVQTRKVNLESSLQNYNKQLKVIEVKYNKARNQFEQAQKNVKLTNEQYNLIKLEYIRQKNLYDYTKDIISNTEKMSLNKNILTKNYYIAISFVPDNSEGLFQKEELLDMAFSELYTNAQSLLRILSVCGITGRILDSVELADLLYVAYNRDASEVYGVDNAIRAGYDALYTTAPDVIDKKIAELDKIINERALDLANVAIEEATLKSKRKRELEEKERNIKNIIKDMAKMMIQENEDYIGKDIATQSINDIEEDKVEVTKAKTTRTKKGA